MSARRIVIEHNGAEYSGEVMTIKSTALGIGDRGLFIAALTLSGDGTGVSMGDYCLDGKPEPGSHDRTPTAYGMDYITKLLWVCGVSLWEKLPGTQVITLWPASSSGIHLGMTVRGLAHLVESRVFIPSEHADEFLGTER